MLQCWRIMDIVSCGKGEVPSVTTKTSQGEAGCSNGFTESTEGTMIQRITFATTRGLRLDDESPARNWRKGAESETRWRVQAGILKCKIKRKRIKEEYSEAWYSDESSYLLYVLDSSSNRGEPRSAQQLQIESRESTSRSEDYHRLINDEPPPRFRPHIEILDARKSINAIDVKTTTHTVATMPGPSNTLLIEGSFSELSDEVAQYIDTISKVEPGTGVQADIEPLLAQIREKEEAEEPSDPAQSEQQRDDVLKKIVGNAAVLNSAPEKGCCTTLYHKHRH